LRHVPNNIQEHASVFSDGNKQRKEEPANREDEMSSSTHLVTTLPLPALAFPDPLVLINGGSDCIRCNHWRFVV
jgi:hypothetical protein